MERAQPPASPDPDSLPFSSARRTSRATTRSRARFVVGLAAAATAVTLAGPAVASAQFGSLGTGSTGLVDTGSVPPGVLFPPTPGIGAGEGVAVVDGPEVDTTVVMDGLNVPWDVVRTPGRHHPYR
ncbi:hypothetical protein [Dietzia sp. Alg238-R159]|uniref:hypothetical protein n=1 Tax=Dietzia sp. Alg238-R159 TaxID=2305986 RepID=UPI001F07CBB1|nr:hypothetical protein [Dietzia sp. Alg238-R159]